LTGRRAVAREVSGIPSAGAPVEETRDVIRSRISLPAAGAALAVLALVLPARAGSLPADALPLPNRVATADAVVVGKVTSFEEKPASAAPFPGSKDKVEYKVAVITVGDALLAPKGTTTLRLGFVPPPAGVAISPPPFVPAEGQEGCFFLAKHPVADFYLAPGQLNFLDKKSGTFEKDVALVKRCTKILEDPNAALKGKDAEERFLAAAMLVARYSTRPGPNATAEPIEAEQSKLILEALAGADWTPTTDPTQLSPAMVLGKLPLTDKDGWAPPAPGKDPKAYATYAQQWVKDHASSYRIPKFVAEKGK
jgi:hypothetical protein